MKKLTLGLILLAAVLVAPAVAFAQPSVSISDINNLIDTVKSLIWTVFGVLAVIMFVIAGITFMTAQGDPEKIATARSFFIWGVVGIAVAIIAYSIVAITSSFF